METPQPEAPTAPAIPPPSPVEESAAPGQGGPPPPWREKANTMLSNSSTKLREAATKAGTAVAGAASGTSNRVKSTWESTREGWQANVQPRVSSTLQSTKEGWQTSVQPKMEIAARVAAETGAKIKKGILDTRDRVSFGTISQRVAEATRNSLERSRSFLVRMEILPPEANPRGVFGVALERVVGYHSSPVPVPHIVVACTSFIEKDGMVTEYLFYDEGDPAMITRLMKIFERDDLSDIPAGYSPRDVAQLLLAFFRCLPEPVLTYDLYDEIVAVGGSDVSRLKELISSLPPPNRATLEPVLFLLSKIAKEEELTKMDVMNLANEWAPVLIWKKGTAPSTTAADESVVSEESAKEKASGATTADSSKGTVEEDKGAGATPEEKIKPSEQINGDAAAVIEGPGKAVYDSVDDSKALKAILQAVRSLIENSETIFRPEAEPAME